MTTPDDILRDHSPHVRQIVGDLRRLIHDTIPEMTERAYPGWHGIGFRHPKAGYVCGIFPLETSVRLLFEHGRLLSDPNGVFTGGGKQTRYLDIGDREAIPVEGVRLLLLEAVALQSAR